MKFKFPKFLTTVTVVLALTLGLPAIAFAYVGPGAGLSIIGSLLSFVAAIIIGVFGFLWFPIRRFLRKRKQAKEQQSEESTAVSDAAANEPDGAAARHGDSDA